MTNDYSICTKCVMDTTDPDIEFDKLGVCNHCRQYDEIAEELVFSGDIGRQRLEKIVSNIKRKGINKDYDCVIGVSGGVDSSYTLYKAKELGLRPFVVHLDNGWNSELAVKNIKNLLKKLDVELHTYVIDWEEFKDLQLSFLRASTPDIEIPTDHAIFSIVPQIAKKIGVKCIIWGLNHRTETHIPRAWSQGHSDWRYIKSINKKFGKMDIKTFPHMNIWTLYYHQFTLEAISILDYLDYVKADAKRILERDFGWEDYGGKHYESIYTRFYQGYILPRKFGYDKRKSHFSSLICSEQMTREEALLELEKDTYPPELQMEDKECFIKKLCITDKIFDEIMNLPPKTYSDYPSYSKFYKSSIYKLCRTLYRSLKKSFQL